MKQDNMTSLLEKMSTEQLDELLNQELRSDTPDADTVRTIMSVLREREKDMPVEITPEIQKAWEKCQRQISQLDKRFVKFPITGRRLLQVASIVVVLIFLISFIPQQAEAESFFDKLARWTSDIVEFFSPNDDESRIVNYEFKTDNPGLQEVYDTLTELGVTEPVVPMWLPEGYELTQLLVDETFSKKRVQACFSSGDDQIIFYVDIFSSEVLHIYEKDNTQMAKVEIDGTTYHIMRNNDKWVAVWTKDKIECSISIDCQEVIFYEILGSIYVMEDN